MNLHTMPLGPEKIKLHLRHMELREDGCVNVFDIVEGDINICVVKYFRYKVKVVAPSGLSKTLHFDQNTQDVDEWVIDRVNEHCASHLAVLSGGWA